ncbi:MAG: aminoacetone oxidase family FAD-binding enzyme [Gammaproteobacteria bacterium]|jgi:predicted Rossmann fold flavoprotein|nr:aminoacetone oxidase family FAD-binding enzyme [Gammaproteobacteria bacterium]
MPTSDPTFDVVIIGAGAAGLMCAIAAGRRGRRVLVADHANKVGKKILMSGGGRCNFTNMHSTPDNFLSANPHFCKSALSRYTPWDFIALVDRHEVPWHEKKLGQLFCDRSSKDIVGLLLAECEAVGAEVRTHSPVSIEQLGPPHRLTHSAKAIRCESLVIATGGYSIPRMGATGFGFDFARDLGLRVQPTRAALVPFVFEGRKLDQIRDLAGVSLDTYSEAGGTSFRENILFTHLGLSGPAMLQTSSYWQPGQPVSIDLLPGLDLDGHLRGLRQSRPRLSLKNALAELLPRRVAERWCELWLSDKAMAEVSDADIEQAHRHLKPWRVWPAGTEGYRTAEVTIGGVDTECLSSKTMECRDHPGVFFIGEVVDVTGHLGGHNFQWAWASGHAAGEAV